MQSRRTYQWVLGAIVLALGAVGCQSVLVGYEGARIQDGYGIAINAEGEQGGLYQTRDLTVRYHYQRSGQQLRIAGEVVFQDAIKMNFNVVPRFNLSLVVADAERNVLAGYGLCSIGFWTPDDPLPFSRVLTVPEHTVLMVFTYQGSAREGGGGPLGRRGMEDDGIGTTFWEMPLVR